MPMGVWSGEISKCLMGQHKSCFDWRAGNFIIIILYQANKSDVKYLKKEYDYIKNMAEDISESKRQTACVVVLTELHSQFVPQIKESVFDGRMDINKMINKIVE